MLFYGVLKGYATEKRRKQVVVSGWEELEMWGELRTWKSPHSSNMGNVAIWEDSGEIAERTLTIAQQ